MIIDAKDLILGRIATVAAKKALLGEKVDIVNCEHAVITGSKPFILRNYQRKRALGIWKAPLFPRMPDRLVRRTIRGMLPNKRFKGREAFKMVMCYIGVPDELKDKKLESINGAHMEKLRNVKYLYLKDLCRLLGWKG